MHDLCRYVNLTNQLVFRYYSTLCFRHHFPLYIEATEICNKLYPLTYKSHQLHRVMVF